MPEKGLLMTSGGNVGKTKNSPYVHHSCKYVDGILSPTACYSLDFPPLWCNKFKVLPHWATIEHIYILFGALQSFRKGSQSAKELLCVRSSGVYSSGGSWVVPRRLPRQFAQSYISQTWLIHIYAVNSWQTCTLEAFQSTPLGLRISKQHFWVSLKISWRCP